MSKNIAIKVGQSYKNKYNEAVYHVDEINGEVVKFTVSIDKKQRTEFLLLKNFKIAVTFCGTPWELISEPEPVETIGSALIDDLYNHRNWLLINLAKQIEFSTLTAVWKSRKHSDGTSQPGWFILGIGLPPKDKNQITYHLPEELWSACDFVQELETSPWDGHSSTDVIERLKMMAR